MFVLFFIHILVIAEVALGVFTATRAWNHAPSRWFLAYTITNACFALGNLIPLSQSDDSSVKFSLLISVIGLTSLAISTIGLLAALFFQHWWHQHIVQWIIGSHALIGIILVLDLTVGTGVFILAGRPNTGAVTSTALMIGPMIALLLLTASALLQFGMLVVTFIRQQQHRVLIGVYAGVLAISAVGGWVFGFILQLPELNTLLTLPIMLVLAYAILTTRLFSTSDAAVGQALGSISDAVAITDQQGSCVYANSQANILGWNIGQILLNIPEHNPDLAASLYGSVTLADRRVICSRTAVRDQRGHLRGAVLIGRDITELERRTSELEQERVQLSTALEELSTEQRRREALTATIRALALPVIPILEGVLVIPLVGEFDTQRTSDFAVVLLQAIKREHATLVLIDITGVPLIDTQGAMAILRTTQSARLLGARCMLVGVRPEIAQTLVSLGVNFNDLATAASLREGLRDLLVGRAVNNAPAPSV